MESHLKHMKTKKSIMPFIGDLDILSAKSGSQYLKDSINFMLTNGTPLKINFGPVYFIALDKPEDVRNVLMSNQCFDKPYFYNFLRSPHGLISQTCKIFVKCFFIIFIQVVLYFVDSMYNNKNLLFV